MLLALNEVPSNLTREELDEYFIINLDTTRKNITVSSKKKIAVVPSCRNVAKVILQSANKSKSTLTISEQNETSLDILQYIPKEIISEMDEETIETVRSIGKNCTVNSTGCDSDQSELLKDSDLFSPSDVDFETALVALIAASNESDEKWVSLSLERFKEMLQSVDHVFSKFTVVELMTILSLTHNKSSYSNMRKNELVNLVSKIYGNGSVLKSKPKRLKEIVTNQIKKWPIQAVNVAYAQLIFEKEISDWESQNLFYGDCTISTDTGKTFLIPRWYAQPTKIEGVTLQPIIDPHHIFVNNRSVCCSKGIPGMHIHKEAWWRVAKNSRNNNTGLSLEIAKELRDRQKNAFAQTTFSAAVEEDMGKNGDRAESEWCRLIRNWYSAVDGAAINVDQRIEMLLDMRKMLLPYLRVGHFLPPGLFVASLPIAQFEGILGNIDRRLQLYAMTSKRTYNQRSVTSLDSDTFFSAFQDYDPKGSGVLRPDDIPTAIGVAVCLFSQRLNNDRRFYMKTSSKTRVYPENRFEGADTDKSLDAPITDVDRHIINVRSHFFDLPSRKTENPRRKSGLISTFDNQSRGAEGARFYHRNTEEKIWHTGDMAWQMQMCNHFASHINKRLVCFVIYLLTPVL